MSQAPSQIEAFNLIHAWYIANFGNGSPTVTSEEPSSAQGMLRPSSASSPAAHPVAPPDAGGGVSPGSVAALLQVCAGTLYHP